MDALYRNPVMSRIIPFTEAQREHLVNRRPGETKLGERVLLINENTEIDEALEACSSRYVVLGIPEDIGVRANFGRPGAESAWNFFLPAFLNLQSNQGLIGDEILILGQVNLSDIQQQAQNLDPKLPEHLQMLYSLVAQVDAEIAELAEAIAASGKTLIVIGGGHNNSYPLIKGVSRSLGLPLSVINIDPHADLRAPEGRHSGNGFTYAFEEGFLAKYHIFGLQEELNNEYILRQIHAEREKSATLWQHMLKQGEAQWSHLLNQALERLQPQPLGLEIDMDSVTHYPASAFNANGYSETQLRALAMQVGNSAPLSYVHICEAAPILEKNINRRNASAKYLALLLADIIKSQNSKA